jgi:hypothetical protein
VNTKNKKLQKIQGHFLLLIRPFTGRDLAKFFKIWRASHFSLKKGQTAMELAVFGAILIFMVGVIVRQALSASYLQNQSYRAMRQAMTMSYKYSGGLMVGGSEGTASHNTASILFIEDRLSGDSAKYGAIDRTPYVTSASATHSRNLLLPVDANEVSNLPIYDVFINGRHFPFTTAGFKPVELAKSCKNASPCPGTPTTECKGDCSGASVQFYPANASVEWEDNCGEYVASTLCSAVCDSVGCSGVGDCDADSSKTWTQTHTVGCAKLYDVIYNHPGYLEWCDDETGGTPCPGDNLTADERFDLNRDGVPDVPGTLGTARGDFSWQWFLVAGYNADVTSSTLTRGAGIVMESSDCEKDCASSEYTVIDVDGDLKRESIMIDTKAVDLKTGIITGFTVMDMQDGDLDFTRGDSDTGPEPGLQKEVKMYSSVTGGTYLLLEEGRLYDPDIPGQYIRTTQKKDRIDLIERSFQLSNDTGRFCDSGGNVVPNTGIWSGSLPNPVEACNDCFTSANVAKTCMVQDPAGDGTQPPVIYVRSRVVDRRGRKWVTNTSSDDYVDFTLPAGP